MRSTVKLPKIDDTSESALVVEWLIDVGATVSEGDPLVTVEGDKVAAEIPSPMSGTLTDRLVEVDDEVPIGAPLAVIES